MLMILRETLTEQKQYCKSQNSNFSGEPFFYKPFLSIVLKLEASVLHIRLYELISVSKRIFHKICNDIDK